MKAEKKGVSGVQPDPAPGTHACTASDSQDVPTPEKHFGAAAKPAVRPGEGSDSGESFEQEVLDTLNMEEYEMIYVCGLEIEEKTGERLISFLEKQKNKNRE